MKKKKLFLLVLLLITGGITWFGLHFFGPPMVMHVLPLSGRDLKAISNYTGLISSSFSPDGQFLALVYSGKVELWEARTARFLKIIQTTKIDYPLTVFSPDGKKLLISNTDGLQLYEIPSGNLITNLNPPLKQKSYFEPMHGAAFSSDGQLVAGVNDEFNINIWKISTQELIETIPGSLSQPKNEHPLYSHLAFQVALSPDNNLLLQDDGAGKIYLWDRKNQKNQCIVDYPMPKQTDLSNYPLHFSPDGQSFFIYREQQESWLRLYDTKTCGLKQTYVSPEKAISSVMVLPDGHTLLMGGINPELRVWDSSTGQILMTTHTYRPDAQEFPLLMQLGQDGRTLLTLTEKGIVIWDFQGKRHLFEMIKHQKQ